MSLDPARMSVAQLAKVFAAAGGSVTAADLRRDIESGAPTNDDGTLNLVQFTAWLAREEVAK